MARTSTITMLIVSCSLAMVRVEVGADDKRSTTSADRWFTSPKPQSSLAEAVGKSLGEDDGASSTQPAVHLNSTGMNGDYDADPRDADRPRAVNRLRAIRNADLLKSDDESKSGGTNSSAHRKSVSTRPNTRTNRATAETSRRRKSETAKTSSQAGKTEDDSASEPLPSVVARRGTQESDAGGDSRQEPTLAEPTLAEPTVAEPSLAETTIDAEPSVEKNDAEEPAVTGKSLRPTKQPPALAAPLGSKPKSANVSQEKGGRRSKADVASLPTQNGPKDTLTFEPVSADDQPLPFRELDQTEVDQLAPTESSKVESLAVPGQELPLDESNTHDAQSEQAQPDPLRLGPALTVSPDKKALEADGVATDESASVDDAATENSTTEKTATEGTEDDVLLTNRSPILVVKTQGRPTIRVGATATYFVTASNVGDLRAEEVEVSINVPSWAEVTRHQPTTGLVRIEPNQDGNSVMKWTLSTLEASAQEKLRIELVPRSSRPIELGVTWNFKSVSAMTEIQVQEPKLQMSVTGPQDIQFGDTKMYTISVSNPGTGDAENVVLTLLPINDGSGTAGVRELGTLRAGTRRSVEVELTARQAGLIAIRATSGADGGLQAEAEQKVQVRRANLQLEATAPPKKYAGTDAKYGVKVINNGDATAQDVVVEATLPMGAKYITSTGGGSFDSGRSKVRWSVGSLRPGAFQIVEVTTTLMTGGKNRFDARASAADQLSASGMASTEVESLADLKLMVNDPQGAVAVGTEMIYEVKIVNRGTKAANHVNVVGYFSEGIEPITVHGWRATVDVGQVIFEQIPRIAPGQEVIVKVTAQAHRAGDHVFRTELDATDPETKLAVEEWTRFYGDEVEPVNRGDDDSQTATVPDDVPVERLEQRR